MEIHAVMSQGVLYLCHDAEKAKDLCLMESPSQGADVSFGCLSLSDLSIEMLMAHDTTVWRKVDDGTIVGYSIKVFHIAWEGAVSSHIKKQGKRSDWEGTSKWIN